MKTSKLYKLGLVGLAALFIFMLYGPDPFHEEDRTPGHSDGATDLYDPCPLCKFRSSASSTEPLHTLLILPAETTWMNEVTRPVILLSKEPICQLPVRGPPSCTTS
jgi:hypothetical protein